MITLALDIVCDGDGDRWGSVRREYERKMKEWVKAFQTVCWLCCGFSGWKSGQVAGKRGEAVANGVTPDSEADFPASSPELLLEAIIGPPHYGTRLNL